MSEQNHLSCLRAGVLDVIQTTQEPVGCEGFQFRLSLPRRCIPVCQNYLIQRLALLFQFLLSARCVCLSYIAGAFCVLRGLDPSNPPYLWAAAGDEGRGAELCSFFSPPSC